MDNKGISLLVLVTLMCIALSSAGTFNRGSAAVESGSNYHGLSRANGNVGFARRNTYIAGGSAQDPAAAAGAATTNPSAPAGPVARDMPNMRLRPSGQQGGWTAWGIIAIIVCVIVLGFCGYYGIICYPLFNDKGNRYDHMADGNSTTTTTSTPTRSPDFGKMEYEQEEEFRGYPKLSSEKGQWATAN